MSNLEQASNHVNSSSARLGSTHGYRIEGDSALLHADVDILGPATSLGGLTLQLWACEEPYQGGSLSGIKVAESPLTLPNFGSSTHIDVAAFAHTPASTRDYAMVMVLATNDGAQNQVIDFANYARPQRFFAPHLDGSIGYRLANDTVELTADLVNPREESNMSGSLALQLWALRAPYRGGLLNGELVASANLGQLGGGQRWDGVNVHCALHAPTENLPHVALVLCEWTVEGYQPRDHVNFVEPLRLPSPVAHPAGTSGVVAPAAKASAPAVAQRTPNLQLVPKAPSDDAAAKPATTPAAAPKPVAVAAAPTPEAPAKPAAPVASAKPAAPIASAKPVTASAPAKPTAVTEPAKPATAAPAAEPSASERPSLNTASAEAIAAAGGISVKLALTVTKARPFKSFEELSRVRGIGDKTVQRLRKNLSL